ncbi:MAG: hypothetical protein ACYC27_02695 [Armatimonadota bacterium]
MIRDLNDIIDALKNAKESRRRCTLLIGSGCSVTAGIPTGDEFVDVIKRDWPSAYKRASEKTYPICMSELTDCDRRDMIAKYVDNANINWAHICIAQLIKEGYVDRIFTTNFDPLIIRSCALMQEFPAIYDFAASQEYKPNYIPDKSIFYLHGQRNGFVLMNTQNECRTHSKKLSPVFRDAGDRMWIIVGYSGQCDPVFEHLAIVRKYNRGLYWIGYKDEEPSENLRMKLLLDIKDAYYVKGFDADSFFISLCQRLECFPPKFIDKPFAYLSECIEMLTPFPVSGENNVIDVKKEALEKIRLATEEYDIPINSDNFVSASALMQISNLNSLFMASKYDDVISQALGIDDNVMSEDIRDVVFWSYIMIGNTLLNQAEKKTGAEADELYRQAYEKYEFALKIKPDMHEALNNWGLVLSKQADNKTSFEADELYMQACEKYKSSIMIEPNNHNAFNNWGLALFYQFLNKTGVEADELYMQACGKYESAIRIKPDKHEALYNWGLVLLKKADDVTGIEADELYRQACMKFESSLKIEPNDYEALTNMGLALLNQANKKTGAEADELYRQACEKLLKAESLSPGSGAYNLACISVLKGEIDECRNWLNKAYDYKQLPSYEHIIADSDLDSVNSEDWFKDLCDKIK